MTVIRPETAEDIGAIYEVNRLAFGQENEAKLVNELRKAPAFVSGLSLVAVDNINVIGHILFSPIRIESKTQSVPALALAPMAVRPDYQRKGVGSELVRVGLSHARALGHRLVVVVGHPGYYPRFGFTPARSHGIEAPFPVPDEAFMILELVEKALSGVWGTVKYPPQFDTVE
jgi:putative acetyltransferase